MREKMLRIAKRIKTVAHEAGGNIHNQTMDALRIIVECIEEELDPSGSWRARMEPEDPTGPKELWGNRAPVASNIMPQAARDVLERIGVERAQDYGNDDVKELADLIDAAVGIRDIVMGPHHNSIEACNLDDALKQIKPME